MSNDMTNKIGIVEIVVAVLVSVTASWVYVKEDLSQLNARMERAEDDNKQLRNDIKEYAEVNKELAKTLNSLNVVLSGMKVKMDYIEEGITELKKEKREEGAK